MQELIRVKWHPQPQQAQPKLIFPRAIGSFRLLLGEVINIPERARDVHERRPYASIVPMAANASVLRTNFDSIF